MSTVNSFPWRKIVNFWVCPAAFWISAASTFVSETITPSIETMMSKGRTPALAAGPLGLIVWTNSPESPGKLICARTIGGIGEVITPRMYCELVSGWIVWGGSGRIFSITSAGVGRVFSELSGIASCSGRASCSGWAAESSTADSTAWTASGSMFCSTIDLTSSERTTLPVIRDSIAHKPNNFFIIIKLLKICFFWFIDVRDHWRNINKSFFQALLLITTDIHIWFIKSLKREFRTLGYAVSTGVYRISIIQMSHTGVKWRIELICQHIVGSFGNWAPLAAS